MPYSVLLAAAALSAPAFSVDLDDYPDKAMRMNKSAAVLADVVVNPKGEMIRCDTVGTTGDADLAERICGIYDSKRHRPARFADGSPAWFVERDVYKMYLPGTSPAAAITALRKPDLILEVEALPAAMKSLDAMVVVAVDANGQVTDCAPDAGDDLSAVTEVVCANAGKARHEIFRDGTGTAVPYVTRMRFRLQTPTVPSAVAKP